MADWVVCASCRLRHSLRPDSLCPRCHGVMPVEPGSPVPTPPAPSFSRGPAAAPSMDPPAAPSLPAGPDVCQLCGTAGPTHYVEFRQNVGLVLLRLHRAVKGHLCSRCVREQFGSMTTVTLFGGWWGLISFFLTPVILVANVVQYLGAKEAFRSGRAVGGAPFTSRGVVSSTAEPAAAGPPRKGLAVASLVLGLLGTVCFGLFGVVPLAAVVLGFVALNRVARQPDLYGGRGLALGGIATGGLGLALTAVFWAVAFLAGSAPKAAPTRSAFEAASRQIDAYSESEAFGNTGQARAMAQRFSRLMTSLDRIAFTGRDDRGPSLSQGHFLTYVELRDESVCFLVHVPQLRAYDGEVRRSLLELAWMTAKEASRDARKGRDLRLGVGLRGAVAYGAVATGMGEGTPKQELGTIVSTTPLEALFDGPARKAPPSPPVPPTLAEARK